jgi:hypothetical protein
MNCIRFQAGALLCCGGSKQVSSMDQLSQRELLIALHYFYTHVARPSLDSWATRWLEFMLIWSHMRQSIISTIQSCIPLVGIIGPSLLPVSSLAKIKVKGEIPSHLFMLYHNLLTYTMNSALHFILLRSWSSHGLTHKQSMTTFEFHSRIPSSVNFILMLQRYVCLVLNYFISLS